MKINQILYKLYKYENIRFRKIIINSILKLEDGEFNSKTLRKIYSHYHKVNIGLYSYGWCSTPYQFDPYTTIGRYCSIAHTSRVMNRNHPSSFISTHPYFYLSQLKFCNSDTDLISYTPLNIGNDVWIGHNALILPNVKEIGHGSIIGAGAVVTKDVPPFAIAVGNPAHVIKYRFSDKTIKKIINSNWWSYPIEELKVKSSLFNRDIINGNFSQLFGDN